MVDRTVIGHTPIDVVVNPHVVAGSVTMVRIAETPAAGRHAAAVAVAEQVVFPVGRVVAGANPGHIGRSGAGRTTAGTAPATGTQ